MIHTVRSLFLVAQFKFDKFVVKQALLDCDQVLFVFQSEKQEYLVKQLYLL